MAEDLPKLDYNLLSQQYAIAHIQIPTSAQRAREKTVYKRSPN
ncbi:hypothetical protein [Fischerella sp.]|nr:hypothetical protein [Fischerella sp.]